MSDYSENIWSEFAVFAVTMIVGSLSFIALSLWLHCNNYIGTVGYYAIAYAGEFISIGIAGLCMYKYGMWRINKYYGKKNN